ncbi:MAG TPA: helix-turn-helix transcriptional regulator [Conexibacter sp.]|nr:helix-turn-helix transcriptional regulator [Conexibacter sp.]
MKRKPIRLTQTSYAVLALFQHLGEATSYDLKQALERSIENFWQVPHTTAYDEPARLASGGYLSFRQETAGRRRKLYALTELGREALRAWLAEPVATPPQLRDEVMLKVFAGAEPEPLLPARRAWHEAKLTELEGYLALLREAGGPAGPERSLIAGISYHRRMLEMLEELADAAADQPRPDPGSSRPVP